MSALFLQPRAIQAATFSPRLQHAVRLLQMSSDDFARLLAEQASTNPFLEIEDTDHPVRDEDGMSWASEGEPIAAFTRSSDADAERDGQALQALVAPVSLSEHLQRQIGTLRLRPRERLIAGTVAEALDEDGYLRLTLEDIGDAIELPCPPTTDELEAALAHVQACDPPGVGARTVAECLALQLAQCPASDSRALAEAAVRSHLALVASHNLPRLAIALGASVDAVRDAVSLIRRLDAHPGWKYGGETVRTVSPDVAVRKQNGRWVAKLAASALPRVRLNRALESLAATSGRNALNAEMAGCLEQARWTVANVGQRLSTILRIARAIVSTQQLFLEYGPLAMKPLGLREIADAVGVHPSTVSRTVRNKYIATPWGVVEMHHFFARGMAHATGHDCAPVALKQMLAELIEAEPAHAPLTDAALTALLAQQGFRIARRTVSKYRQELGVEPVERRRIRGGAAVPRAAGASPRRPAPATH